MAVTTEQGKIKPVQELEQIEFMTGTELEKADIEKPFFIIKKVLPTGLAILASPPKFGKSWLVLLMALCITRIGKLDEMLYQQDFIEYWSESKNGSGGKVHHFKRTEPPFNN